MSLMTGSHIFTMHFAFEYDSLWLKRFRPDLNFTLILTGGFPGLTALGICFELWKELIAPVMRCKQ